MRQYPTLRALLTLAFLAGATSILYRLYHSQYAPASSTSMAATPPRPAVIVVGSGLAGLSAAFAALHASAPSVVLLERSAKPGGNSIKASSGINGAPTRFQNSAVPDTSFFPDTIKSAGRRLALSAAEQPSRERLISLLTNSSASAVAFLSDDIDVDLSVVAQLGGHSIARTHRGAGKTPPGADIITRLLRKLKDDERFELKTECEVTRLLSSPLKEGDGTVVVGVEYRSGSDTASIKGPVVFATGGFAGDANGLLAKYRPDLAGLPSTNDPRPGMHNLLTNVGAHLVDMDSVQIHPTGFVDPSNPNVPLKFLAAEMLRGEGAILLRNGRRFVNEMETREHVSRVIMELPPTADDSSTRQWDIQLLLDPGASEAAASHVSFYVWKGLLSKKKISELDETTRETIKEYSHISAGQQQDKFGRSTFGHWRLKGNIDDEDQEVWIGNVTPITHFTMGGIVINEQGQVLSSALASEYQVPVKGLWAAGEVTGGVHGDNRLGGSSLLECVVFGRIAGEQAASSIAG